MTLDRMIGHLRWARTVLLLGAAALLAATARPGAAADLLADGAAAYEAGDYGKAALTWRPLAEDGDAMAQFNLGLLLETGRGVTEDPAQAAVWYERAARQGVTQAQYNLALLHQAGRGVAPNATEALYWLEVAARHGTAAQRRQPADAAAQLAPLLSAAEVESARARARAFSPCPEEAPVTAAGTALILSPSQIAEVQRRLAAHGYDPGPPDGIPGAQTRNAVRRYLADRGFVLPEGQHLSQGLLDLVREP